MALFSALLLIGFNKADQRREAHEDITLTPPLLVRVDLLRNNMCRWDETRHTNNRHRLRCNASSCGSCTFTAAWH